MTNAEIRRRALHAAAAVAFTIGLAACSSTVVVDEGPGDDGAGGKAEVSPAAPAPAPAPTEVAPTPSPTASVVVDPPPAPDAGPICQLQNDDWSAYSDCCNAHNWDFNAGCEAWGPPMPPVMPEVLS